MKKLFRKSASSMSYILGSFIYMMVSLPALGHEFWLEPKEFQPKSDTRVEVTVRNGQRFNGSALGYFKDRIVRFDVIENGDAVPVNSRSGDFPAVDMPAGADGLMVMAYQSTVLSLTYKTWEKFADFAQHKDFKGALRQHTARNLPMENFGEIYTRYCKTLIGVGAGAGNDIITGLKIEFLALDNPYTDDLSDGFSVRLQYEDEPRAHAQIEVFEKAADGAVNVFTVLTDRQGFASIPVNPAHTYLLDSVVFRAPSAELSQAHDGAVWETHWASLTFATP